MYVYGFIFLYLYIQTSKAYFNATMKLNKEYLAVRKSFKRLVEKTTVVVVTSVCGKFRRCEYLTSQVVKK